MNVQEKSVREIIKQCKKCDRKIVAGGPLFTHEFDRFEDIASFVLNEAEITLPLFLEDLKNGTPLAIYQSTDYTVNPVIAGIE